MWKIWQARYTWVCFELYACRTWLMACHRTVILLADKECVTTHRKRHGGRAETHRRRVFGQAVPRPLSLLCHSPQTDSRTSQMTPAIANSAFFRYKNTHKPPANRLIAKRKLGPVLSQSNCESSYLPLKYPCIVHLQVTRYLQGKKR